jgi:lipoprotein-anchoring transpeptidase ErfK/SrfK
VKRVGWRTEWGSHRVFGVADTRGRWAAVPTPLLPNNELAWVRLDPHAFRAQWTPYSVSVDLSERRAALLRGDRVLRSFAVTVGAPGSETPTGRFAVTDSFMGNLNAAYGCCAIALTAHQPNLPSGWLGGNRIAIHGTSGPLGVALSHGCVRAADADVRALVKRLPAGTPVTIAG